MQTLAEKALASSRSPLSLKLQSILSNTTLGMTSVTSSASTLIQSLISGNRITVVNAQEGALSFGFYNCLSLIGTGVTITSNPAPSYASSVVSSYRPLNLTIGFEVPPPPAQQESVKSDGLPLSAIGAIIG